MSNLTTKFTQTSLEINGNPNFTQIRDDKTSQNFTHCFKCEKECISDKISGYCLSTYNL